jgi:exopolyphosphatase/guanosine-5'-triphosphate,3'-diphosphate pyrophosphatase
LGERVRVAAIDIGSNAIRMTVAEHGRDGVLERVDRARAAVRLGHDTFISGRITREKMEAACEVMADFRRRLDRYDVERYRAVATSAVRDAENGTDLVDRAWDESAITIEVIGGDVEAALVWRAVTDRMELSGRWLLVDLGGGSMEVSTVDAGGVERSGTYPLGTVRLLERLDDQGDGGAQSAERALHEFEADMPVPPPGDLRGMLATGGNIEELAERSAAEADAAGVSRLPLHALETTMDSIEAMSYDRRVHELGMRPDRADVIVPAGRLYRAMARRAGVDEIVVPNVGVTEGVLLELASRGRGTGR